MKPQARVSMERALAKEGLEELGIVVAELSDYTLRGFYNKLQYVQQGSCKYWLSKGDDFQEALLNNKLQLITFQGEYRKDFRRLTFKEYLYLVRHKIKHPSSYPHL